MIEQRLIEECKNGDLLKFRELIESASPFAFSVAFRIMGEEETAKDIVQDTMVTVWEKLGKINSAGSFKTWLYRIVINKCYDQLRKRRREPEMLPDENTWALISNHVSEYPVTALEIEENGRLINFMMQKLSPKQKAVFILSEIEEMSSDEIADITGMSKTVIKANLHHARKRVNLMLEKYL